MPYWVVFFPFWAELAAAQRRRGTDAHCLARQIGRQNRREGVLLLPGKADQDRREGGQAQ